ncbi:MAG: DUF3043 domain-containing protein [Rothia sp. (in: high G+C Gram-positive bacteria)]|nr:DUF3043 domain-containing protein [Rothia sp. (in: high G+C Gram-positive bacteria)]
MFGRKKKLVEPPEQAQAAQEQEQHKPAGYTAPKGRPTPSRKEQEAARRQPLVPKDRKAAKEANRQAMREQRLREQEALQSGDERYLPARDKGPQRRYVRDYIDARFNIGDYMIFIILGVFVFGLFSSSMQAISAVLMWVIILVWVLDTWFMWRRLKKKMTLAFGQLEPGLTMYAINRVLMIRRFRLPKPQVKRGDYPRA